MVRNVNGGNKAKGQGRKFLNDNKPKALRVSEDPLEIYARVSKNLGNGMVDVDCIDGKSRLCFIRGKFRGRGKKDNFVGVGSWVLVGLRDYESGGDKKKRENCDLLEVYNDFDKERLKMTVNINWGEFIRMDNVQMNQDPNKVKDGEIVFQDASASEYEELMLSQAQTKSSALANDEEEINVDDI